MVILVPGIFQPSGPIICFNEMSCKFIEATEVVEAVEVTEAAEVLRSGKSLNEDFRVIQVLEFSFISMFSKNIFFSKH